MKKRGNQKNSKNFLQAQYGLPAKKAGNYVYDVSIEEISETIFKKRWDKYRSKLVPKRPTALQKRCSAFLKKIQKRKDDGPVAKKLAIRLINTKVGYGVFALKPISEGTIVGYYAGILRYIPPSREEEFTSNCYLFGFQGYRELINFSIDAEKTHNFTAFFNHASPRSSRCNLEASFHFEKDVPRIVFIAKRRIEVGEQLCYSYGTDYWRELGSTPQNLSESASDLY